uniref:Uncharacterized protein n=1 Tax=Macrostomum lignano TaxID=282301 RepID=A0A1I8HZS0_9PLAT
MINLIDLLETQQLPAESVTPQLPIEYLADLWLGVLALCCRSDSEPPLGAGLPPASRATRAQFQANAVQFPCSTPPPKIRAGLFHHQISRPPHPPMLIEPAQLGEFSRARQSRLRSHPPSRSPPNVFSFEMPD